MPGGTRFRQWVVCWAGGLITVPGPTPLHSPSLHMHDICALAPCPAPHVGVAAAGQRWRRIVRRVSLVLHDCIESVWPHLYNSPSSSRVQGSAQPRYQGRRRSQCVRRLCVLVRKRSGAGCCGAVCSGAVERVLSVLHCEHGPMADQRQAEDQETATTAFPPPARKRDVYC
jgi:hypothetical protein